MMHVRVSTNTEEQPESFNTRIDRYKRIICEEHTKTWEFAGIYSDTDQAPLLNEENNSRT